MGKRQSQSETNGPDHVIPPSFGDDQADDMELWLDPETHELELRKKDERPDPDAVAATIVAREGFF